MKMERTSQRQIGKLEGPFQVFRLVTEMESSPGKWSELSEFFLVCLENFGPVAGFAVEGLAIDDAKQWNADFFNRLTQNIQQKRLKNLNNSLAPGRQLHLQAAIKRAYSVFGEASEDLATPSTSLEANAGSDPRASTPRTRVRF